jgi:hypothetical protein
MADGNIVSESSVGLLKQVLDPFHDTQLNSLSGWADANTAPSIVRCVKQTQVITQTALTTPWDLHICNWEWVNATPFASAIQPRNNDILGTSTMTPASLTTTNLVLGGVQAWVKSAGTSLNVCTDPAEATLDLGSSFVKGASRIVGVGFEAVDVTPEIYKGGQVGVYRLTEPSYVPDNFSYGAYVDCSAKIVRPPPANFAQLMLIPGSRQWAAKDGCYVPVPFKSEDNPALLPSYLQPLVEFDGTVEDNITSSASGYNGQNTSLLANPACINLRGTAQWPAQDVLSVPAMQWAPIHQCGALFSGLQPNAAIALTVIYYVEEFPGLAQQDLLTLANPSPDYDYVAMKVMSSCFKTLPVGVPAGMNGLGDWFALAVRAAGKIIAPIAMAAGQPAIAALAGAGASFADAYLTPSSNFASKPTSQEIKNVAIETRKVNKQKLPVTKAKTGNTQTRTAVMLKPVYETSSKKKRNRKKKNK